MSVGSFARHIFFALHRLYDRNRQYRIKLNREECEHLVQVLDVWIEGYRGAAHTTESDLVEGLHDSMSISVDTRNKIWRKYNG